MCNWEHTWREREREEASFLSQNTLPRDPLPACDRLGAIIHSFLWESGVMGLSYS